MPQREFAIDRDFLGVQKQYNHDMLCIFMKLSKEEIFLGWGESPFGKV